MHATERHTFTQLADVNLTSLVNHRGLVNTGVLSCHIDDEVAAFKRELAYTVGTYVHWPESGVNILEIVHHGTCYVIQDGRGRETVNVEQFTGIVAFLFQHHLCHRSIAPLGNGLRVEFQNSQVRIAVKATFPVTTLIGMPAVDIL